MKWEYLLIWACTVHITEACFEDGEFYCAKLWYFWFVIFFVFVFMLIAAIVITNLCKKKKRRVGPRGKNQRRTRRTGNGGQGRGSKASIISRATATSNNTASPQFSNKFPLQDKKSTLQKSSDGEVVSSKRFTRDQIQRAKPPIESKEPDMSRVEKGMAGSMSESDTYPTRESVLTTRDLPTSLVTEEDETTDDKVKLDNDVKEASC